MSSEDSGHILIVEGTRVNPEGDVVDRLHCSRCQLDVVRVYPGSGEGKSAQRYLDRTPWTWIDADVLPRCPKARVEESE